MLGSHARSRAWLATFCGPESSPAAELGRKIFRVSLTGADLLKPAIITNDEKTVAFRWFLVLSEFLGFFLHMTNRFVCKELGHERRCEVQEEIHYLLVHPTVEAIFGHWSSDLRTKIESELSEKLNCAESEYAECKQLLDRDDMHSQTALFSKFANNIVEIVSADRNDNVSRTTTFKKAMDLALDAFKELDITETIRILRKETKEN